MITITGEYLETIDSTNNEIKRRGDAGAAEGLVISADRQETGRGRRGHVWQSPAGATIATSLLLRPTLPAEQLHCLTLVAALGVQRAIREMYCLEAEIKWPNDVIIHGKKICGILTELCLKEEQPDYVVVGIGVNVHDAGFPKELADKATSLDLELKKQEETKEGRQYPDRGSRRALTERIWQEFSLLYDVFCMTGDLSVLMEEYNRYLVNRNRTVRVLDPAGPWEGIARGINAGGELLVETKDDLRRVDAGEVSVRGVYGYV